MTVAKDYDDASRKTAVPTLEEMIRSAKEHPEVWKRGMEQRAKNIEHAQSQPSFDPVVLREMIEHQKKAQLAFATAWPEGEA